MVTINYETREITDGTHTMTPNIHILNDVRMGGDYIHIDPFGTGRVGKRVPAEKINDLVDRVASEVFPKFVEFEDTKNTAIYNELSNLNWAL